MASTIITYQPASGAPVPVSGIFDQVYVLARGDADAGVETLGPAVFLRLRDLPSDPNTDDPTIVISGAPAGNGAYRVRERISVGLGSIVLGLRKLA